MIQLTGVVPRKATAFVPAKAVACYFLVYQKNMNVGVKDDEKKVQRFHREYGSSFIIGGQPDIGGVQLREKQ